MKILCIGDCHLRYDTPENRKDDYPNTQMRKFKWCIDLAIKNNVQLIIQAGDLTEHFPYRKMPYKTLVTYMRIFDEWISAADRHVNIPVITVYGQHDANYHSDITNTPLAVLEMAGLVKVPNPSIDIDDVCVCGMNYWADKTPKPSAHATYSILVCHKMVSDSDYWHGHVEYINAKAMLEGLQQFDLIITGDNHKTFTVQSNHRWLINPGSLTRIKTDQFDHKPAVFIVEHTGEVTKYHVPIQSPEEVLDVTAKQKSKESEYAQRMRMEFIKRLGKLRSEVIDLDYISMLKKALKEEPRMVREFFEEKIMKEL